MWSEEDDAFLTPSTVREYSSNWNLIAQVVFLGKCSGPFVKERYSYLERLKRNTTRQVNERLLSRLDSVVPKVVQGTLAKSVCDFVRESLDLLIGDSDLPATVRALEHCCTLLQLQNEGNKNMFGMQVFNTGLTLLQSPLLDDPTLSALLHFFETLGNEMTGDFREIWGMLFSCVSPFFQEKQVHNVASSAAALFRTCDAVELCSDALEMLLGTLRLDMVSENFETQRSALLFLGKTGRARVLTENNLETIVTKFFKSDDLRDSASYALGNLAVGNLPKFLPFILDQINRLAIDQHEERYQLLQSLKEVLGSHEIEGYSNQILASVLNCCEDMRKIVRVSVAECLAKLALITPDTVVSEFFLKLNAQSPASLFTVVMAFRFATVEEEHRIDDFMRPEIPKLLSLLTDADEDVKHGVVLLMITLTQFKSNHLNGFLNEKVLHNVFELTSSQNGVALRTTVYECFVTLVKIFGEVVKPSEFIPYLKSGLEDEDVRDICLPIISLLAMFHPWAILGALDLLVEALETTISFKPKTYGTAQQHFMDEKTTKNALSAITALEKIDAASYSSKFKILKAKISTFADLSEMYRTIKYKKYS